MHSSVWGDRLTTVWPCQGHYPHDSPTTAIYPAVDIVIDHIGDMVNYDLLALVSLGKPPRP